VSATFDPSAAAELLLSASNVLADEKPTLVADGGVENFSSVVDELAESGSLDALELPSNTKGDQTGRLIIPHLLDISQTPQKKSCTLTGRRRGIG
jgi:hypothetical protein